MSASCHWRTPHRGKSTSTAPSSAANGALISTPNQRMWKMSVIHRKSTSAKMARAFFSWKLSGPIAACCASMSGRPPSTLGNLLRRPESGRSSSGPGTT